MLSRRRLLQTCAVSLAASAHAVCSGGWDTESHDLVVVGSGAAGLAAAVAAHREGLSDILILEREPLIGGSSVVCGGQFSVAGTNLQKALGIHDSEELFFEDMMRAGEYQNDPELVRVFIREVRNQFEWLQSHGVKSQPPAAHSSMSVQRAHQMDPVLVMQALRREAVSRGSVIRTSARAVELEVDEHGKATGVWVVKNHRRQLVLARKGLILACGGFSRNRELLKLYAPEMVDVLTVAGIGSQGDGILMANKVNAALADIHNVKASYGFLLNSSTVQDFTWMFYSGAIIVNHEGRRFVDESLSYRTIGDAALKQSFPVTYIVFDNAIRKAQMSKRLIDRQLWSPVDRGENPDYVFMSSNLEELAVKAGIDAALLRQTVERYNRFVEQGRDEEFGRTSLSSGFGKLVAIRHAPFFLVPAVPGVFGTYGGLKITPKAEVVSRKGTVIKGLYAAGEVAGGVHGNGFIGGTGFGKALALGKIAGTYASRGF